MEVRIPAINANHGVAVQAPGCHTEKDFTLFGLRINGSNRGPLQGFLELREFEDARGALTGRHIPEELDVDTEGFGIGVLAAGVHWFHHSAGIMTSWRWYDASPSRREATIRCSRFLPQPLRSWPRCRSSKSRPAGSRPRRASRSAGSIAFSRTSRSLSMLLPSVPSRNSGLPWSAASKRRVR